MGFEVLKGDLGVEIGGRGATGGLGEALGLLGGEIRGGVRGGVVAGGGRWRELGRGDSLLGEWILIGEIGVEAKLTLGEETGSGGEVGERGGEIGGELRGVKGVSGEEGGRMGVGRRLREGDKIESFFFLLLACWENLIEKKKKLKSEQF